MPDEQTDLGKDERLRRWLETTRTYLFTDLDSLPGPSVNGKDRDTISTRSKQDTCSTAIARKRDQRRRLIRRNQIKPKSKRVNTTSHLAYVVQ